GANPFAVEVPAGDEARTEGRESVGALDPQHGTRVGVAEVVQPEVVADRVSGDKVTGLGRGHASAGPADHDRYLALVVQVLAIGRPDHRTAVSEQRRGRLVEVRGGRGESGAEFGDP